MSGPGMRCKLIAVLFSFLSLHNSIGQTRHYQFARLDVKDGLSHNYVNDILRDAQGFMWFATASGLNRYDGYTIKTFRNVPGDTSSVLVNEVNKIFEGPEGKVWAYTHSGNSVYNPDTETFHRNTDALLKSLSIAQGVITYMKKDSRGNFWFVHYNQGLFRYDTKEKKTLRFQHDSADSSSIVSHDISVINEDPNGNFWIIYKDGTFEQFDGKTFKVTYRDFVVRDRFKGELMDFDIMADSDGDLWINGNSNHGCLFLNMKSKTIRPINTVTQPRLNSNIIRKIIQANDGLIWIATDHGGINVIDKKNDFSIRYIMSDEEDERSISQNSINCLYKSDDGIIWAGTYKQGVSYYHEKMFRFTLVRNNKSSTESLPFNDVNAFAEDAKGNLWIGTNGGGLIHFDRSKNSFKQFLNDPKNYNSLSSNIIVSLCIDHEGVLWIGTYYGGLNSFDGEKFIRHKHDPSNPKSLGDESVWEILEDSKRNLWIGTLRGGVDVYDRSRNEFLHYRGGDFNSIHTTYVPVLKEDSEGNMWIGTGYGIDVLEKQSGRFVHYLNNVNDPTTISNNSILCVLEDSRGLIWVGTQGGLNLFDKTTKTFTAFQEKDGLPHNSVLTLVEDDDRNLWLSSPSGISKITVTSVGSGKYTCSFRNYDESDGLQGKAFNENAALKCSTGEIVFGGSNGFNIFNPRAIRVNENRPNVILTDFQVFNKSVKVGEEVNGRTTLSRSVSSIDKIILGPATNVFSIEFAALNFFHPEKSQYKYTLEGFNQEWLATGASQRRVTFTNLDAGDYIFKVKASNNDGVWNEVPAQLHITVLPPFWKSEIAFFLYAIIIIGALILARWLILTKERMSYSVQKEREEAQRMHELDMMKIRFFTNVSHEFRTPITLILTPIEKMLKQSADEEQKKQFLLVHRNARRLLNLVNQLLDFRRMEVQEVKLNPSEGDIVKFIGELVHSFSDLSEKKNIRFFFNSTIQELETMFDQDKVEKILFNLLSNAFKFTPENGSVTVDLNFRQENDSGSIEIKVKDTGIGIPADKQDKIFERFFQNELPKSLMNQGSGIGLSITKEFVKVQGGTISVESEPGKGSCFTVLLPVTRIAHPVLQEQTDVVTVASSDAEQAESFGDSRKPVLLLVEDNEDFRFYLKDNLKFHYSIMEASNGKQALQKALSVIPDLIVSDIMMPEMNGIEFCRQLKADPHTSHIPVILLTARSAEEQKLEGFEAGANDYITKPFNFEILQSRIKNLITQRETFQKNFQKHFDVKATDIEVTSLDEKLIQNAMKVVEEHLSDPDFSVEELSREIGMSRVHLYKKLLSLTGKSPIEFIRTLRLQRAAQLLEKSQLTVAEVAYQVGFNNPKYFARYFKEQFHVLPSAYASARKVTSTVIFSRENIS